MIPGNLGLLRLTDIQKVCGYWVGKANFRKSILCVNTEEAIS